MLSLVCLVCNWLLQGVQVQTLFIIFHVCTWATYLMYYFRCYPPIVLLYILRFCNHTTLMFSLQKYSVLKSIFISHQKCSILLSSQTNQTDFKNCKLLWKISPILSGIALVNCKIQRKSKLFTLKWLRRELFATKMFLKWVAFSPPHQNGFFLPHNDKQCFVKLHFF